MVGGIVLCLNLEGRVVGESFCCRCCFGGGLFIYLFILLARLLVGVVGWMDLCGEVMVF